MYGSLEEEVLDIAPESLTLSPTGVLARSGTSDEVIPLMMSSVISPSACAPRVPRRCRPCGSWNAPALLAGFKPRQEAPLAADLAPFGLELTSRRRIKPLLGLKFIWQSVFQICF